MRYLIALLALVGLTVSVLALRVHYSNDVQPCDINEHWDCGIVNHSSYAEIRHIPVAAIGIAGYGAIALLALMRRPRFVLAAAVAGLAYALYLTHVEAHILQVWCLYCVISLVAIASITLLSLVGLVWRRSMTAH